MSAPTVAFDTILPAKIDRAEIEEPTLLLALANLDIVTVRVRTGDTFPPCDNCASWVPGGGS